MSRNLLSQRIEWFPLLPATIVWYCLPAASMSDTASMDSLPHSLSAFGIEFASKVDKPKFLVSFRAEILYGLKEELGRKAASKYSRNL